MRKKYLEIMRTNRDKDYLSFDPTTLLAPLPVIMATVGEFHNANIITIAWTGIVNSKPPMTYISVNPIRHSYEILKEKKEFVINLIDRNLVRGCDWCGVKSGREFDKWKELGLEKVPGEKIHTPAVKGAPAVLECKVKSEIYLGSHTMFLAEIVNTRVREDLVQEDGAIAIQKAGLVTYAHGNYYSINSGRIGQFGFSVMKPKTKRKLMAEKKRK